MMALKLMKPKDRAKLLGLYKDLKEEQELTFEEKEDLKVAVRKTKRNAQRWLKENGGK